MKRFVLSLVVLLACVSTMPLAGGTANKTVSVSGTVTVANETANGDTVTVTPLDNNYRRAGKSVNVSVSNGSFTANGVTNASFYFVRLSHDGLAHYALTRDTKGISFDLSATVSGRVVTENGSAISNARLLVTSPTGPPVGEVNTSENGTFDVGPLQPNTTYTIRMQRAGVPYKKTITTDSNATDVRFVKREPTSNDSVLTVSGGTPASHVIQVSSRQNASGLRVVETLTLNNTGDQPFVGPVHVSLPDGATPTGAMFRDQRTQFTRRGDGVVVNATVAANDTVRIGIAYNMDSRRVQKSIDHDTDRLAVVLRGYNLSRVSHSSNLRPGSAPIPILTNATELTSGDQIRIHVPEAARQSTQTPTNQSADGNSGSDLPVAVLGLSFLSIVAGGILAYRVL
ncbi:carboxypeptidase-like regulatory domain-containing protein [Haladaptatus sp. NG-SE-30]